MPKETIQHGKHYWHAVHHSNDEHPEYSEDWPYSGEQFDLDGSPGEYVDKPKADEVTLTRYPHVEVHWSRAGEWAPTPLGEDEEGKVQVLLDMDRFALLDLAKRVEADTEITASAVVSNSLTRYQINQMIKTLRRARDAAFGTDE